MRTLTYNWAQSLETLLGPEQVTLAQLIEAESRVPPYTRDGRTAVHAALKELHGYLHSRAKELLEAQAAHLNERKKKRKAQGPTLVLGRHWRTAIREGLLLFPKHKAHALRVTLRGWERAVRIADDLFTMAALRGYEPVPWKMWDKTLRIRAVGAELDLRIMEKLTRVQDDAKGSATGTPYENYFVPTGAMSIHLSRFGGRIEVVDEDGASLESQLEELFDRIPREFVLDLAQNRERQRDEEASAQAREAKLERERLKELETIRRRKLDHEVQSWHRALMIRQYAEEVERAMRPDMGEAAEEWLKWVRVVADEVDPTSRRCYQLKHTTAGTTSQEDMEDADASDDTTRRTIRTSMESSDFEALPRVWPLRQWPT
ncbi:hypothetical protein [Achromobacter marplatensis]|uniref:Uncharacterized protein n=1 Tax=Achromobacter marplatensis TaxID=470868 RepID=A0AA42WF83_9BURK|nr:hypothetical protein [Achromobacter marplatensis]MDH2052524.1 hypothetical protein [Achromobacter marplatensis]